MWEQSLVLWKAHTGCSHWDPLLSWPSPGGRLGSPRVIIRALLGSSGQSGTLLGLGPWATVFLYRRAGQKATAPTPAGLNRQRPLRAGRGLERDWVLVMGRGARA